METFANLFKENRQRLGLTQRKIANALNVSQTAVYLWESGRATPTMPNLVHLEELFGVTPGALLIPCAYALSADQEAKD
jgi:transcriptional regulator with XRE-family HTH domain